MNTRISTSSSSIRILTCMMSIIDTIMTRIGTEPSRTHRHVHRPMRHAHPHYRTFITARALTSRPACTDRGALAAIRVGLTVGVLAVG
jgi:hypothetical protein